jgi:hypothetical protein
VYPKEHKYPVLFDGTKLDNADSDGDGVRDGADDADHDDLPNMLECSRVLNNAGSYVPPVGTRDDAPWWIPFTNPFNPCLPATQSRTCPNKIPTKDAWAPFNPDDVYYFIKQ